MAHSLRPAVRLSLLFGLRELLRNTTLLLGVLPPGGLTCAFDVNGGIELSNVVEQAVNSRPEQLNVYWLSVKMRQETERGEIPPCGRGFFKA